MGQFVYEHMTPGLNAYLKTWGDYKALPHDKKEERDALRKKAKEIESTLEEGELARYHQAKKEWYCRDETLQGEVDEHVSPSGQYKLVVTGHSTGKGTWAYTKGKVYSTESDTPLFTVYRNYHSFPFSWIEGHGSTGEDYLICGRSYMGQTVLELTTGKRVDYEEDSFCWAAHHPSPDGKLLAVEGCYWAHPYELMIFDFSEPMSPPWPLLLREDNTPNFGRWVDNTTCTYGREVERRKSDGKALDDLDEGELEEMERYAEEHDMDEDDLWHYVVEDSVTWTPPPPKKVFEDHIRTWVGWRMEKATPLPKVFYAQTQGIVKRVSKEEMAELKADPEFEKLLTYAFKEAAVLPF